MKAVAGLTQPNNAKPIVDSNFSKAKPEDSLDPQFKPPEASQLVSVFTILFLFGCSNLMHCSNFLALLFFFEGENTPNSIFYAFDVHPNPIMCV